MTPPSPSVSCDRLQHHATPCSVSKVFDLHCVIELQRPIFKHWEMSHL